MDMHRDSGFAGRLAVVSTGRRRRWSVEEKTRIVEESLSGHRLASATARRHDIPVSLLFRWRRQYQRGDLGGADTPARFVPAVVTADAPGPVASAPAFGGWMEIALASGHRIAVGADVDAAALRIVIAVLGGLR